MSKGYERLFESIRSINPPHDLHARVILHIHAAEQHRMKIQLVVIGFISLLSCGGAIFAIIYTIQEFSHSGFYQYLSLLVSDGNTMMAYWKEFVLLLTESLPLFGITLALSSILVFLISLRFVFNNVRTRVLSV